MSWPNKTTSSTFSKPKFTEEYTELVAEMKKLTPKQIATMMKVSEKVAEQAYQRYQNFALPIKKSNSQAAILTFAGDVYRDIETNDYTEEDFAFAQDHIRILSGLYGILKAMDLIQPYRLEMKYQTKYWQEKITKQLKKESDTIINLASNEYSKPIDLKQFQTYNIHFKTKKGQEFKTIPIYAKIARGTMANWIVQNRITKPQKITKFQEDNWQYNKDLSTERDFVFTREQ